MGHKMRVRHQLRGRCDDNRDPTTRFSDRVEDYAKYRPGYPKALINWLLPKERPEAVLADIGSGTGILTSSLLQSAQQVYAVEPNREMRTSAEEWLNPKAGFVSVAGTAEATTLETGLVDLVVCAQSFHWFDPKAAKQEFRRILRPNGKVSLIWNDRRVRGSAIMKEYEALLEAWGNAQTRYHFESIESTLNSFFERGFETATFANSQTLDESGLLGRFFSSSFTPSKHDARYVEAERAVRAVFQRHQSDGVVELGYVTRAHLGAP